jgi:hypothetical protein
MQYRAKGVMRGCVDAIQVSAPPTILFYAAEGGEALCADYKKCRAAYLRRINASRINASTHADKLFRTSVLTVSPIFHIIP